jgi:pyridoxamine 5'-phosphate oxidase
MTENCDAKTPDFSQPIVALRLCHERMRSECATLRTLAERVKNHGCDEQARQVAAGVVRYFDTAARFHHEDEEEDLLPRMMAAATMSRGSSLTRLVADVATEHREMDRCWTELRAALQGVAAGDPDEGGLDPMHVDHFVKLYQTHIAVEEANVFPLAEMLLSRNDLAEIGANMAERRSR